MTPRPIFVVGCARSGTTLLRVILDAHPGISAGDETHFLADLEALMRPGYWKHLKAYDPDRERWHRRIAAFFASVHEDYARSRGKVRWADKTPKYVTHLPFIASLFPDAQIVHIVRDGRDVVASHLDRWGWQRAFHCAATTWRKSVEAGQAFGRRAPAGRYHEIRYEELVGSPEPTLRVLFEFLGEPWDGGVLTFDRKPHDVQGRYARFAAERRAAGDGGLIYKSRVGVGRTGLDPVLRATLHTTSGRLLSDLGYR